MERGWGDGRWEGGPPGRSQHRPLTPTPLPLSPGVPCPLAPRGHLLPRREDEPTAGWTGKVTQSGRGSLRASLPRSAGRPRRSQRGGRGLSRGVLGGGSPHPRARLGAGAVQERGRPAVGGPLLGPPRPPERDDGGQKDFHQIWAGAGPAAPETSAPAAGRGRRAASGRCARRAGPGRPPGASARPSRRHRGSLHLSPRSLH